LPVTIRQIAARSGKSVPTVSHVLNDRPGYSAETRNRVLAAARELGYQPNTSAQSMKSGRFGVVSLLLSTQARHSHLPDELLHSLHDALAGQDLRMLTSILDDHTLTDTIQMPRLLRSWCCDGLIVNYNSFIPTGMIELIRSQRLPAVWVNCDLPSDSVLPDDYAAGVAAVQKLLELGHRRIAYADFSQKQNAYTPHYSAVERQKGYRDAMREAGLAERILLRTQDHPSDELATKSRAALSGDDRVTAVVGYARETVEHFAEQAMHLGLRIPADVSLVSFGGREPRVAFKPLSLFQHDWHAVGSTAVRMLALKIADRTRVTSSQRVAFKWVPGATIATAERF
jgi:LacI family transcriptional regulator